MPTDLSSAGTLPRGLSPAGREQLLLPEEPTEARILAEKPSNRVSTFVFLEDHRFLSRSDASSLLLLPSSFTSALPPNCPLFKATNNSSTPFLLAYGSPIGLHTYMHDYPTTHVFPSTGFSPPYIYIYIFHPFGFSVEGKEGTKGGWYENSIGGDRQFRITLDFEILPPPAKDEKPAEKRPVFPSRTIKFNRVNFLLGVNIHGKNSRTRGESTRATIRDL